MYRLFLQIFDLSLVAGLVILLLLPLRLLLKRAPRVISYALWAVVLFRLLCPWSPESDFSPVPRLIQNAARDTAADVSISPLEAADAAYRAIGDTLNGGIDPIHVTEEPIGTQEQGRPAVLYHRQIWLIVGAYLWPVGMAVMLLRSILSLWKLRRQLACAIHWKDRLYVVDHLPTAFVYGLIRPKIYLPSGLSETEQSHIVLHEQVHLRRKDHWFKLLAYAALTIHWFNPLVWLAFSLACRDMESACDEAVIRRLGTDAEAEYAASLLRLSSGHRMLAAAPLAFGEGNTGARIRHILRYKKPVLLTVAAAALIAVVCSVVLATNPVSPTLSIGAVYDATEVLYRWPLSSLFLPEDALPSFCITGNQTLYIRSEEGLWEKAGTLKEWDSYGRSALTHRINDSMNNRLAENLDYVNKFYDLDTDTHGMFWSIFTTNKDDVIALLQYGDCDSATVHYALQLQPSGGDANMDFLELSIKDGLGMTDVHGFSIYENDAIPGTILVGWIAGADLGLTEFQYEVDQNGSRRYTSRGSNIYTGGALDEDRIRYFGPTVGTDETELFVLLSNNPAFGALRYTDGSGKTHTVPADGCPAMLVFPAPDRFLSLEYLDREGNLLERKGSIETDFIPEDAFSWLDLPPGDTHTHDRAIPVSEGQSIAYQANWVRMGLELNFVFTNTDGFSVQFTHAGGTATGETGPLPAGTYTIRVENSGTNLQYQDTATEPLVSSGCMAFAFK